METAAGAALPNRGADVGVIGTNPEYIGSGRLLENLSFSTLGLSAIVLSIVLSSMYSRVLNVVAIMGDNEGVVGRGEGDGEGIWGGGGGDEGVGSQLAGVVVDRG